MSVKDKALQNVLNILSALKCEYKIITLDGQEHGELVVVPAKSKRGKARRPAGTFSNYIRPFLEPMKVGDVAVLPFGQFDGGDLQSNVTSQANHKWGRGSYKTCITGDAVEILRIN